MKPMDTGVTWSDGIVRSAGYAGTDLYRALRAYFAERNEEERLRLLWENEYIRTLLARERTGTQAKPQANKAAA